MKDEKLLFISETKNVFDSYELFDPDELVDPEQLRRFHVVNCPTLKLMRSKNKYDKYVVATRTDGKFIVNFVVGDRIHHKGERVERRLYACKHCLNKLELQKVSGEKNATK